MRITVLGSGTSSGVPAIGCDCAVCTSTDPKDRRTRPSILIETPADGEGSYTRDVRSILVDTSTDLREQALARNVRRVDAILFTHTHADHVFGLDDVRRFNHMQKSPIPSARILSIVTLPNFRPPGRRRSVRGCACRCWRGRRCRCSRDRRPRHCWSGSPWRNAAARSPAWRSADRCWG